VIEDGLPLALVCDVFEAFDALPGLVEFVEEVRSLRF